MNQTFLGYRCSICGSEYNPDEVIYNCPKDYGNLDVVFDYDIVRKRLKPVNVFQQTDTSIWRYQGLLPLNNPDFQDTPIRSVGFTPIYRLSKQIGEHKLPFWLKDESRNPTASFKDRASAVVVMRAREIGAEIVVTASTGNAGAALAGMAAAVGQKAVIFAPKTAPPAKVAQLLVYGAQVILVDGTYDDAFELTIQAAHEYRWYCRNTGYNPFTAEGKKTAALEIWEWIFGGLYNSIYCKNSAAYDVGPDSRLSIFISVGDGNIISGLHKGFMDLQRVGWLDMIPRLYGVQAEGSAAITNAYIAGTEAIVPVRAETIADSISVDLPRDGRRAVRAARETGGGYITVKDEEILQAIADLGKVGVFAEPAGATAYAGMLKAFNNNIIKVDDPILVINTGSGLKDIKAASQSVPAAPIIEPTLSALKRMIK